MIRVYYDAQSGAITSSAAHGEMPLPEGTYIDVEQEFDLFAHYVKDGALREYPERPGDWAVWNYETETWTDPRTVEEIESEFKRFKAETAQALIDTCIGFENRFITPLPAQQMKYARKEAEARAYLTDPDPLPVNYPWIMAEVGITAPTAYEVAQVYLNMAELWVQIAVQYEPLRLTCVNALGAATTKTEVIQALATFRTQMTSLVESYLTGPVEPDLEDPPPEDPPPEDPPPEEPE